MEHGGKTSVEAFATEPISRLVIKNSVPALIAMVMVMVYNLADVFFIGLTHDDLQVAAVSLATPVFMIFMSLGTLFGVGGTSVISRALGAERRDYAKKVSAFCMWSCVAIGLAIMLLLWAFLDRVSLLLGASENTLGYTKSYLGITLCCGVFSMISNCFSSIVRTEGEAMKAMTGTVVGNLLNIILDPIMILGFRWGIVGAAVATVIGNLASAAYYLLYFLRGKSALSIRLRDFSARDGILKGVVSVGISASLANLLVSVSSIIVNGRLSGYGDMYVAGYGVTSKIVMIVTLMGIGVGSGVQPLVGYYYGAKNRERLLKCIRFAALFGLCLCFAVAAICWLCAGPLVKIFLTDSEALSAGVRFTRILMTTGWLIGAFAICQNSLQAMGAAAQALLASLFRQGVIFVPMVFLLNRLIGLDGLIWAQPAADLLSLAIIVWMLVRKLRGTDFSAEGAEPAQNLPGA